MPQPVARKPDLIVSLRGGYGHDQVERAIGDLAPIFSVDAPVVLRIDLGGLAFVGPTVIALLDAAVRRIEDNGWLRSGSSIVIPRSPMTAMYLHRMNLYRVMKSLSPAEEFKRREPVGFRPCQEFSDEKAAWMVAKEMSAAVTERVGTDNLARHALDVCMTELAENVIFHADTSTGFAAAQGNPRRNHFEVGVVDLGQGIRGSLSKNPKYADIPSDVAAIETALQPRVTATPERNSGIGLFITAMLLNENDGTMLVRSGFGRVVGGVGECAETMPISLPGTIVAIRARTDRPLDLSQIYRRLPNGRTDDDKLSA